MAKLLKLRRGTTTQHGSFTGAEGEVTIDTTKDTAVVHDGSTTGGTPLAKEDMSNVSSSNIAGRLSNDSITPSKIGAGALPTDVTVASANIVDGTIVNADVNASAAIAGTKVSPAFGSQDITTTGNLNCKDITLSDTSPVITFTDTDNNPDFRIKGNSGNIEIEDVTNNRPSLTVYGADNHIDIHGNLDVGAGIDVTGNITATGNIEISNTQPTVTFTDTDHNPDFLIRNADGGLIFNDATNGANRLVINSDGHIDIDGNLDVGAGVDVTGNITVTGTVDGVDVAALKTSKDALSTTDGSLVAGVLAHTYGQTENSNKVATTSYVRTAVSDLVDSSPAALNTLNELAAAINDDASFSTTVTNNIATKMPLAGGEFTGNVTTEDLVPDSDSFRNIGTSSAKYNQIHAASFHGSGANLTGIVSFVSGMIILWSGNTGNIPSGWVLCDGSNSTPDLRNRFVIGAGSSYNPGNTGGATTDNISVSVSGSDTVSFNTTLYSDSWAYNYNTSASWNYVTLMTRYNSSYGTGRARVQVPLNVSDTVNISGTGSATVDTVPPYYALCYIMKT